MSEPSGQIDPRRQRIAKKNIGIAICLGLLFGPLGYVYTRSWKLAAVNILTVNYFLCGIVLVPIHAASIIRAARRDLWRAEREDGDLVLGGQGDVTSSSD